ncbi:hypothetical protein OAA60_00695 [Porticoccaceae bacterium]|nr:hypothetical protein [Porticoccaceae bacterium]
MTLLSIIEETTDELGIAKPSSIVGNTDRQIAQLLSLANREGRALARRGRWSTLVRENTFTLTTSTQDQGAMNSTVVTDGDFKFLLGDTLWDRTTSLPITGAVNSVGWQTLQAFPVTGPYFQFMLRSDGHLWINPAPGAADTVAFDYYSTAWCEQSDGTARNNAWGADTDVGRLDEDLMTMGLKWRWLRAKGLDYSEEYAEYERAVIDDLARDGGKPQLSLESRDRDYRKAGIIVPIGSWSV